MHRINLEDMTRSDAVKYAVAHCVKTGETFHVSSLWEGKGPHTIRFWTQGNPQEEGEFDGTYTDCKYEQ